MEKRINRKKTPFPWSLITPLHSMLSKRIKLEFSINKAAKQVRERVNMGDEEKRQKRTTSENGSMGLVVGEGAIINADIRAIDDGNRINKGSSATAQIHQLCRPHLFQKHKGGTRTRDWNEYSQ